MFATLLKLTPYNDNNEYKGKLVPVSYATIQAVLTICPNTVFCVNRKKGCKGWGLLQSSAPRDIPLVTVIKEKTIYQDVPVLMGKCSNCDTTYYADNEHFQDQNGSWNKCYLNSARFLKIGQALWVDRKFSHSVLSGMYNFHASASAYTQFWNDCNPVGDSNLQVTRCQIWQTYMQESIRSIASTKNINLELAERLTIKEVAEQAFSILGDAGRLEIANDHSCSQCTQPYKAAADFIVNDDPAAVIGADEDNAVPALVGENAALSAQETQQERNAARIRANALNADASSDDSAMDIDIADVTMRIINGILVNPTVSRFNNLIYKRKPLTLVQSIVHGMVVQRM